MSPTSPALRYAVLGLVVLAALVALGSWLVRTRRVSPFGVLGRALRTITDPIVKPVERRLVRMGGNPVHAGGWLVVITAVAGIVFLSLAGWFVATFQTVHAAASGGLGVEDGVKGWNPHWNRIGIYIYFTARTEPIAGSIRPMRNVEKGG